MRVGDRHVKPLGKTVVHDDFNRSQAQFELQCPCLYDFQAGHDDAEQTLVDTRQTKDGHDDARVSWPSRARAVLMGRDDCPDALVGRARDLWALVDQDGVICASRESISSGQAHVERTGVETTRSRARPSKSDIIRSYDRRHGLWRAPEGGRRVDGRPRVDAVGLG